MPVTRPTGDQLRFQSSQTGEHVLDSYMEDVERGGRTLAELIDDLWTPDTGDLRSNLWDLRVNPVTFDLEQRVGDFQDDNTGWTTVDNASFFKVRGDHADATEYKRLDIVFYNNTFYICTVPHTSTSAIPSGTNFEPLVNLTGAGVTTFNGRSGAVLLSSADVTTALGYTPTSPTTLSTTLAGYLPLTGGIVTDDLSVRSLVGNGSVIVRKSTAHAPGYIDFVDGSGNVLGSFGGDPTSNEPHIRFSVFGDVQHFDFNATPRVNGTLVSLTGHTHTIANITDLQAALDGKANTSHTHPYLPLTGGTLTGNVTIQKSTPQFTLDGNNPILQLKGSASTQNPSFEFWGNVSNASARFARIRGNAPATGTSGLYYEANQHVFYQQDATTVLGTLTSASFALNVPLTVQGTNVISAINSKANLSHTHIIADVTGLQAALDGKQAAGSYAAASHTHTIANITGLQAALDGKQAAGSYAAASHTHVIADITNLQSSLDGKANSAHTHTIANITNLQAELDGKQAAGSYANAVHTHTIAQVTNLQSSLDAKAPLASPALTGTPTSNGIELGFRNLPLTSTGAATAATTIVGKGYLATGNITIPNSTFAAGDIFSIINNTGSTIQILQGSGLTLRWAGTTQTGNRNLLAYGMATVTFVSPTVAIVAGAGVT